MKTWWTMVVVAVGLMLMAGCATQTLRAGPVITGISGVGDGSVIVEKCIIELTEDMDYIGGSTSKSASLRECSSHQIILVPKE